MSGNRSGQARILLVEDSPTQGMLFSHLLDQQGYEVSWVTSGEEALENLNSRVPDLIIADFHLPGMNGDVLTRRIRLDQRTRTVPVLMLTEARPSDVERQGLESGADAYVSKSAGASLIELRIKALLRERLNVQHEPDSAQTTQPEVRRSLQLARVLVVDVRAQMREYLSSLLLRDGCSVEAADGSVQALQIAKVNSELWDCVVVGACDPPEASLQLCRDLQALRITLQESENEPTTGFRIVGLGEVNTLTPARMGELFAAGADDVLLEGSSDDALLVRIRALVRRKLLQDEARTLDREMRDRELALERSRAEARTAEALALANQELASANRKLRDAQAKLVQAAKMASLGELVAGIAHEINNPLAFILGHQRTVERLFSRIRDHASLPAEVRDLVDRCGERVRSIQGGLKRIEDIVYSLRKFSRLDGGEMQLVDVHAGIDTVLALLAHKLKDRIAVKRRYDARGELVCSPALVNQAVMNVVSNAADAIAGTGSITIETRTSDASFTIEITDTGPGVPEDLRDRIFEPFFTTKPVGSGTGLGLAIAFNVVELHGGQLQVSDAPGGGARFTITVPRRSLQ